MAFFDKLNDLAKNIGDKTGDAIETAKLSSKLGTEKTAIAEDLRKLGELIYARYLETGVQELGLEDLLASLDAHHSVVADLEQQIKALKEPKPVQSAPAEAVCPACGTAYAPGTRFCSTCGAKIEEPAPEPAPEAAPLCPNCGEAVAPGAVFCASCGTKLG